MDINQLSPRRLAETILDPAMFLNPKDAQHCCDHLAAYIVHGPPESRRVAELEAELRGMREALGMMRGLVEIHHHSVEASIPTPMQPTLQDYFDAEKETEKGTTGGSWPPPGESPLDIPVSDLLEPKMVIGKNAVDGEGAAGGDTLDPKKACDYPGCGLATDGTEMPPPGGESPDPFEQA